MTDLCGPAVARELASSSRAELTAKLRRGHAETVFSSASSFVEPSAEVVVVRLVVDRCLIENLHEGIATVESLARRLRDAGLKPFLDKWHLIPGQPWQEALPPPTR